MLKLAVFLGTCCPPMTEVNVYAEYRGWGVVICVVKLEQGWAVEGDLEYVGPRDGAFRLVSVPKEGGR